MRTLDAQKTAVYFIWIVGIVASVAMFMLFLSYLSASTNTLAGQAIEVDTSASSVWMSCLDQGNKIKLANAAGSLTKADTCLADGSITRVSCHANQYGHYTYEYSSAISCPNGKTCKEVSGIGSCQ